MTTTTDREPDAGSGTSPDDGPGTVADRPTAPTGRAARLVRGRPDDPRWVRPTLLGLLVVTAVTYLWNLGASGWANSFYAAAVQAGTQSPKAWLFGALDAPATVTVDKPPAAMWVMALSGRIFGFSSWSMLVPQALMGVASVALLYAAVRRWSGPRTALAAAALLASMPVAVLMFRFNNPDALLVLLMVAAAYTTVRAVDAAGRRVGTGWLVATGVLIGFGFLTKQLQVMLAVPALALVYLLCAPTGVGRRIGNLLAGGVAMVVSAGWYVALVDLWPASSRPYIGGSTDNSLLQLALGYNGLGRIVGGEGGPGGGGRRGGGLPGPAGAGAPGVGGGPGGPGRFGGGPGGPGGGGGPGGFGGQAGPLRLLTDEFSANASWLLPAALVLLVAALWFSRRAPRTDRTRAALVLWGGWTLVHLVVFSAMSGIIHPYYTVALAPGVAATTALGASVLWRHRTAAAARVVLALTVLGTAVWSAAILTQNDELGWLRWVVVAFGLVGGSLLLVVGRGGAWARRIGVVTVLASLVGGVGASTALAAVTAATPTQGSIVSAGTRGGMGGPGGPGGRGARTPGDRDGRPDARRGGGPEGEAPSPQLVAMLRSAGTTWAAATTGAMSAAPLQLDSGVPVMSIGGFMGSDPAPTLAEFQHDVAEGRIRYFVEGGGPGGFGGPGAFGGAPGARGTASPGAMAGRGGGPGSRGTAGEITTWVTQHFTSVDVGGRTVYDLSRPTA